MKILIKNGTVVTSTETSIKDVLVEKGRTTKIEENIKIQNIDKTIDAKGKYIFPGGIDPHVHMHLPTNAGFSADDFLSGSKAALFGGTTTIIDFVTPQRGQSLIDALRKREKEAQNSLIDYSFHLSPVEWRSSTEDEIKACFKEGITSFKVYMAYKGNIGLDDEDIFKVMQVVGKEGGIVTLHCEVDEEIDKLRNNLANKGRLNPEAHALSRPAELEVKAVGTAIELAKKANCPIYIVHVSAKESIDLICEAQKNGQSVFAETCPQYLLLNDAKYIGEFEETCKFVMSPPLRKPTDSQGLWDAIKEGSIKTIGTDHCPFTLEQKQLGINDFRKIPNGAGGIEHRLELLYTYGVLEGIISLNQFVEVTSTKAAKIFGLYPQKGEIAIGSDADIIIWNPETESIISKNSHHQKADLNIFEGVKVVGKAETVIKSGEIVLENGEIKDNLNSGVFLKRQGFSPSLF